MDRKFLESLGIEKENVDKIMAQHGLDITGYKTEIGTKDATIKKLREDVIEKDGKIAELEKVDVEDLQKQLETEKAAREKDKKDFELRNLLTKEGCTDIDYLLFKLGGNVEFDDKGQVKDTENFVKTVKETYAGQFQEQSSGGTGGTGNFRRDHDGKTSPEKNPYTEKGWNLTEQMRLETTDPERAKKLQIEAKTE